MSTALPSSKSAHLVGICGAGMKALAELLDGLGWRLSGSDLSSATTGIETLMQRGLTFHQGHSRSHLPADASCLIYSPAIPVENPERIEAARRGLPQCSYGQMVGQLMQTRRGVCIAGTHGKSTTTAMVGWTMTHAGRDPSVLVGAELANPHRRESFDSSASESGRTSGVSLAEVRTLSLAAGHRSGWAGAGDLLVVESCEFQRSFLDFQPHCAAILNVEPDHFDCFSDEKSLEDAFSDFANRVPSSGVIVVNGDSDAAMRCASRSSARLATFGRRSDCKWQAANIQHTVKGVHFELQRGGRSLGQIELSQFGDHNVLNGLAAAAVCSEMGVPISEIIAGLRTYPGLRRRFEVIGDRKGITIVNDYAHHPTAVRATLKTAREVFGARRVWCVFQPHQVSRTEALMGEFAASFDQADEVLIAPVFAARERVSQEPVVASRTLAGHIASRGVRARFVESLDRIVATVDDAVRPGDVLIVIGAGDIERIISRCDFASDRVSRNAAIDQIATQTNGLI